MSNANELVHKEQYLAAIMNSDVLFGVITDKQKCLIYEIDVNAQLKCKGHFSLAQMCHYFNSFWIDLDVFPPLEENDYSYTKSGGATDIIVDKLDAAYLFGSQTAVASGVAHPILLTYDMLTLLLCFQPNSNGDFPVPGTRHQRDYAHAHLGQRSGESGEPRSSGGFPRGEGFFEG